MKQTTPTILMIEPTGFGFNPEAAATNSFQQELQDFTPGQVQDIALLEFKNAVAELRELGVEVITLRDPENAGTPDSVFPNNWFSTHAEGQLVTYPMASPSRRKERRQEVIEQIKHACQCGEHVTLELFERQETPVFLEGTGSMVLDRVNKIAYAAVSPRTNVEVLQQFCEKLGYQAVTFEAYGSAGELIYHTNVMMCVGDTYAVVALSTVAEQDRKKLQTSLIESGKEIIEISKEQTYQYFAGNMLQVENRQGERILVMSKAAYESLTPLQLERMKAHNEHLLYLPIHMIEKAGGGSIRCMIAELFRKR
ncbi:arginine deiminase-related protein [Pontibacter sp. BT731]|uniref:citrulline utilization hydrolase CtlX n=1 Tax=Pontibacter coccineus TaxID=3063328 RepID=UPI0026E2325E|nr:arginine deiminase-related protein [Pontibacter sp. BT731]MDO6388864.1 arginine deiminase-related protein [Pontibacter sp. BT731]